MAFATQAKVDGLRLPAGKTEHWEFDQRCTGLSVRLQGRKRSWVVWLPVNANGKRPKMKIGDVAGMRIEEARRIATGLIQAAKDGHDPVAERAAKREAAKAKAADTLGRLIEIYLERRARPSQRLRSYTETARNLLKAWAPLHGRPVDSITRRDVAQQVERIRVESGPTSARNARIYLSGCYSWAMKAGLADHNPIIGTEAPAVPPSRARVLKPEELVAIWNACGDDDFGRIVKLLMLLGQRREEVAGMMWSEIDIKRRVWTIPAARAKNKREHEVPLSDQAVALLPERRPGREHLFGRAGRGAFSGFSQAKARLDQAAGITPWRLHDLRHSAVTHMAEIGIDPHIIEAVVNHQSGHKAGIAGLYNKAVYREQKRAAMQRYAHWLEQLISGEAPASNVVAF
jgi:integrase